MRHLARILVLAVVAMGSVSLAPAQRRTSLSEEQIARRLDLETQLQEIVLIAT